MKPYDHKKIEKKWQNFWEKKGLFEAKDPKSASVQAKFYSLIEFPYPSGSGLHIGHIRSNTAMDIISRKRRAEGFNVLYPIGWDAFGLPTENFAIKTGIHPAIVTKKNTDVFRKQLKALGFSFDWSREIDTTDPKYYKWTQWLFLQFYKHGLAYKKKMLINWCPKDKIGLANEEVIDGCCERCGTPVEKREKEQWMLAITKYADRLDKDLDTVDYLPQIKTQQRNWIGRKETVVDDKTEVTYNIRDWIFSRQRYWGEPIPMIFCTACEAKTGNGHVPVPEKDLPVKLPNVKKYEPTDNGESPLASIAKWVNVKCPVCKSPAQRETDTMPNWAGSSWYFLRYADPKNSKAFADPEKLKYWLGVNPEGGGVDWYNGGMEHTTLHLLYSRFWNKFLFDIGLVPTSEPYMKRTSHGLILAEGGEKMSKSKGNATSPDELIATYGADTLRLYEMFIGPFDQAVMWNSEAIIGPRRFLERVWKLAEKVSEKAFGGGYEHALHKTIKKVSDSIEKMEFNVAVSALMILVNEIDKEESISKSHYQILLQLLAPFTPHITEELWSMLGNKKSITLESWPSYDESKIKDETVRIAVQVDGKLRDEIEVPTDSTEECVKAQALELPSVKKWLEGREIKKVIYVKNRLVNII